MRSFAFAFLLGILFLQVFIHLPNVYWAYISLVLVFLLVVFFIKYHFVFRLMSASLCGFAYVLLYAHYYHSLEFPGELEGKPISIIGQIVSIPEKSAFGSSFLFLVKKPKYLLRLIWQHDHLHVGDQWQLLVRLKRIHGLSNPGGMDYEAIAFQQTICAHGYVIEKNPSGNQLLNQQWYHSPIDRIRQYLKEKIQANLPISAVSPWIVALATGVRENIPSKDWQILRATGTNHLMVVAGLHIGFISGFFFVAVRFCWKKIATLTLFLPAEEAAAIAALLIAIIYSSLAGFSLPTLRACLMLGCMYLSFFTRKKLPLFQAFCLAFLCILIINPFNLLTDSFWLSFGSVGFIIYGVSSRLAPRGLWWKLGRIQWVVALGLFPFSIWLFQQSSLVGFIANCIAIPWVGFIVIPFIFLGTFALFYSDLLAKNCLLFADKSLGLLWNILTYFSKLHWANWSLSIPHEIYLILAFLGILLLLSPIGFPGRFLGGIWILPLIFYQPLKPNHQDFWLTLLDVGQGLSAVIQTKNHVLVFDAGARLGDHYDMGESVVVPFLHSIAAKKIDKLVVSHGDNDHMGGVDTLLNYFPVSDIQTSVPEKIISSHFCLRGEKWQWDGVDFEFLYPTISTLQLGNDSSCVLRISNHYHSVLLTGDIEKFAENNLLQFELTQLAVDVLVAPHHGSKTSAPKDFLKASHPSIVLFPIGYRNRFHFPHKTVVELYRQLGVKQYDTVAAGAIQIKLLNQPREITPYLYRIEHRHFYNVYG